MLTESVITYEYKIQIWAMVCRQLERNGILDLEPKYPEPEKKTYGFAFNSSLTVEFDRRKRSIAWTGDTKIPASLQEAVNQLVQMSQKVREIREGK